MIVLSIPITDTKAKVVGSYLDNTQVTNDIQTSFPNPEERLGKNAVLYINPMTQELFHEYEDRPLTPEEETTQSLTELEADNTALRVENEQLTTSDIELWEALIPILYPE